MVRRAGRQNSSSGGGAGGGGAGGLLASSTEKKSLTPNLTIFNWGAFILKVFPLEISLYYVYYSNDCPSSTFCPPFYEEKRCSNHYVCHRPISFYQTVCHTSKHKVGFKLRHLHATVFCFVGVS